jgi:hypothetical protein
VARLAPRDYARLAREHDRAQAHLDSRGDGTAIALDPVEVRADVARRRLRFRGDPEYCFSPDAVRSWSLDGGDIVIATSPRRAGGKRAYRIELANNCPELTRFDTLDFVSGVDIGLICGNPGDHARGRRSHTAPGPDFSAGVRGPSLITRASSEVGCPIAAVYPDD